MAMLNASDMSSPSYQAILLDLGFRDYKEVWALQKQLLDHRAAQKLPDILILVEHPHVITLGRKMKPEEFSFEGLPVYHVERGGYATYHGPGQLVGYPIVSLQENDLDVHGYVRNLEELLIRAVSDFKIAAERREGYPGVWVSNRKLASIGIALNRWTTYHGFALNVNTDLSFFESIQPCGMDSSVMTSMKQLAGKEFDMGEIKDKVKTSFEEVFKKTLTPLMNKSLLEDCWQTRFATTDPA